jgi:hypothetical protein
LLSSDWERSPNYPPPRGVVPSVRKMTGALYLKHSLAYKGSYVATSVHLYFKLPGGDKWKYTQWEKSVKLGQEILTDTFERMISPKV